ncbi:hypothetical protein Rhopal_007806-T1 [Rhodotorula paludigena]|uniref:F-box domain-containing protein n=1 Tax=Rhodotorula paludigena TaxID=86838 RepID=A0AAV5GQ59_9BASI|nr:hypothetical protein Rhopal_007806-T1 [Rhodotorula paludigena]
MAASLQHPKPTLGNLPFEIKSRIALHCSVQDEKWRAVSSAIDRQFDGLLREPNLVKAASHVHGHSLGALFLTSKDWSEACARHRFQTLSLSRTDDLVYQFYISSNRLHHFVRLELDETEPHFLSSLSRFTSVTSLVLGTNFVLGLLALDPSPRGLFDPDVLDDTELTAGGLAETALCQLMQRLASLEFSPCNTVPIDTVLEKCSNVTSLCLHLEDLEDFSRVLGSLGLLPHLVTLEISGLVYQLDLDDTQNLELPKIRNFTIRSSEFSYWPSLDLAARLAATLETLAIVAETPSSPGLLESCAVFPHLASLRLELSSEALADAFESICLAKMPSLRSLAVGCDCDLPLTADSFPLAALQALCPPVTHLQLHCPSMPLTFLDSLTTLAPLARTPGLTLDLGSPLAPLPHAEFLVDPGSTDLPLWDGIAHSPEARRTVVEHLGETLEALNGWFDRVCASAARGDERPTSTLSSLPLEIKTRIAQLCYEQDERWRDHVGVIATQFDAESRPAADELLSPASYFHGKSLGALFMTCKKWSEVCAPFRFSVLKASATSSLTFRYQVAFTRLQHFTRLDLDEVDFETAQAFLPCLGHLPRIESLVLDPAFVADLLCIVPLSAVIFERRSNEHDTHPIGYIAECALKNLLHRIKRLEVSLAFETPLSTILERCSVLRALKINSCHPPFPVDLLDCLALVPSLTELEIVGLPYNLHVTGDASAPLPQLKRLTFHVSTPEHPCFALAERFSATLRYLSISADETYDIELSFTPDTVFPVLSEIKLAGDDDCLADAVDTIHLHRMPALRALTLELRGSMMASANAFPLDALRTLCPPLRQVQLYHRSKPFSLADRFDFERWRKSFTHRADAPILIRSPCEPAPGALFMVSPSMVEKEEWDDWAHRSCTKLAAAYLDRTISSLNAWWQRIKSAKRFDASEWRRLASALKGVELERFAMEL